MGMGILEREKRKKKKKTQLCQAPFVSCISVCEYEVCRPYSPAVPRGRAPEEGTYCGTPNVSQGLGRLLRHLS